ncbi:MAG: DNA alkylation repair protein [Phycisphaeraceae bacterium]
MKQPLPRRLTAEHVQQRFRSLADEQVATTSQRFFKTGAGDYGEGDRFLGIRVPTLRKLVRQYDSLPLDDVEQLLRSAWHEERLFALLLLVRMYQQGDKALRQRIHRLYLAHTHWVNNWDLVDVSAEHLVGAHLAGRSQQLLKKLARSASLWERRIAVLSTFYFIKQGQVEPTLEIVRIVLNDPHDLIHKAGGWMLREVGKRDEATLRAFLDEHALQLPRTMLRYAIERLPPNVRQRYLQRRA